MSKEAKAMTVKPLRILYMANAPWCGTGYGTQSNSLLPRLLRLDAIDAIAIFAFYGVQGGLTRQRIGNDVSGEAEVICYPVLGDPWGNDAVVDHAKDFGTDAIITLMDIWVQDPQKFGFGSYYWLPWMPIDHEPVPPPVLEQCRQAYMPITYAEFAQRELLRHGVENVYIPHGVETKIFRPLEEDRGDYKEMLGFPRDCFLVGCVGANKGWPDRKGFQWLFEAFARLVARHDDARLYVHTLVTRQHGGPDLQFWANQLGIMDYTRFPVPYRAQLSFDMDLLVRTYNAFDVFALPTMGEGFGLPLIEAQACGVPVIATDFAASAELTREAGWLVPVAARQMSPLGANQAIPDVDALAERLEDAYQDARNPDRRARAREFAMRYDWDELVESRWRPFMEELAETIIPRRIRREVAACPIPPLSVSLEPAASRG